MKSVVHTGGYIYVLNIGIKNKATKRSGADSCRPFLFSTLRVK